MANHLSAEITSKNPVVEAIINGSAPQPARLAAARGLLPLPQHDLLEVLVALTKNSDPEIANAANETLQNESQDDLLVVAKDNETAPAVLSYLASKTDAKREIQEALILNNNTPDPALANLASTTLNGALLELLALNQQRLVRFPQLIEAILSNAARTPEGERRARETRQEFFEKERGARQIADELRARGKTAAAEFFDNADLTSESGVVGIEDAWIIAEHIEVSDADIDDSWLPSERFEDLVFESTEERAANAQRVLEGEKVEGDA